MRRKYVRPCHHHPRRRRHRQPRHRHRHHPRRRGRADGAAPAAALSREALGAGCTTMRRGTWLVPRFPQLSLLTLLWVYLPPNPGAPRNHARRVLFSAPVLSRRDVKGSHSQTQPRSHRPISGRTRRSRAHLHRSPGKSAASQATAHLPPPRTSPPFLQPWLAQL